MRVFTIVMPTELIKAKKVVIVGYGSQGHAHCAEPEGFRRQGRGHCAAQGLGLGQEGEAAGFKVIGSRRGRQMATSS